MHSLNRRILAEYRFVDHFSVTYAGTEQDSHEMPLLIVVIIWCCHLTLKHGERVHISPCARALSCGTPLIS